MRLTTWCGVAFLAALLSLPSLPALSQKPYSAHPGVIRLKVIPELVAAGNDLKTTKTSQGIVLTGVPSLDNLCQQYGATNIQRVFPFSPQHEAQHQAHGLHLWYELRFRSAADAKAVASAYANLTEVSLAEPLYKTAAISGKFTPVENLSAPAPATLPFNDPYLSKQWHYNNTGDFGGLAGSDINLFRAWKVTTGTPNVVVSVHDEGPDYTHEDLAANMWKNMAEYNGKPNVDDDNNGYVDDIYGYNFSDNKGQIKIMEHGTHVSGTIAAVNNNGKGVGGVAGGSGIGDGVRIMACQIIGGSGSNTPASYVYAADNGALISQNSWGYIYPGDYEQATLDAIDYFIAEAGKFAGSPMKGGVVIFAAGNSNDNGLWYPGIYPSVVAVSSLGPNSVRAYYSNYGDWVDIASYGGDASNYAENQVLSTLPNNSYGYLQGTSMATPHVSGIAALITSKHGGPGFTNTMLLTHLLTGVRDVDSFNPDMAGQLGVGISDAALAVATDNHLPPAVITDLQLEGISQDFATLSWSVPSDPDDNVPSQFTIYYSTDSITPANLAAARVKTYKNKNTGTSISLEIDGLQSTSHYYFMVKSIDRWGNVSSFSNEVSGTTNQGPSIALNKSSLPLTVDIAVDSVASDSIKIYNQGAGILKWSSTFRHKSVILPLKKPTLHYPVLQTKSEAPALTVGKHRVPMRVAGSPVDGNDFTPIQKQYYDPYSDIYVIGDEDLSLTNSSATRFTVTEPDGFNLTQVLTALAHDNNTGPVIMEVYLGDNLNTATLTYAQEVLSEISDPNWQYITLDEELFMANGTTFWVVFHVPAYNKYPLGIGLEQNDNDSDNCLYSTNLGKTWTKLSTALSDKRWVFTVAAISERATIGNYIKFDPTSSQQRAGDSIRVTVKANGSTLKNGTYSADGVITTNDKAKPLVRFPINLEVKNHSAQLQVPNIVDFNSIFVGLTKDVDVRVPNLGYGDFSGLTISISNPQFTQVGTPPARIAARYVETLTFRFKPTAAASANAIVTLTDGAGNKQLIYLTGVGAAPPVIALAPAVATVNNLTLGNTFAATINIQNKGKYPLTYAFPKFADANTLSTFGSNIPKFGYAYKANLGGTPPTPAYSFTDISGTEPNIIDHFIRNDFYELDLGFSFPFYGKFYSKIYITRMGAVTFANDGSLYASSSPIGDSSSPSGFITAAWTNIDPRGGGGIHFKRQAGKTIIEYKNVTLDDRYQGQIPSTYQIILYQNGDVELVYDDLSAWDPFALTYFLVGMDDPQHTDGYRISDVMNPIALTSKSLIHIYNPGVGALQSVSTASGIVPAGGTQAVNMTFASSGLYQGTFSELVNVVSNDPITNPASARVNFTIATGGTPQLVVDQTPIDFGNVFLTAAKKNLIALTNAGSAPVQVTAMTFQGKAFSLDRVAPIAISSTQSAYVNVVISTATLGNFVDTLKIVSNAGNVFKIPVHASVVPQPILAVDLASISKSLQSGEATLVTVNVSNKGNGDLTFVTKGTDWLYAADAGATTNTSYSTLSSKEVGGPTYNWIDVVSPGNKLDSIDGLTDNLFWKTVKLPFAFTFFGKKYDTLYVGAAGAVSFTANQGNQLWANRDIPATGGLTNYIAPLWLSGGFPDGYFYADAGVYYKAFADKVVICYNKFTVFGMGNSLSFEAVLYKNGNIAFQYDLGADDQTSQFGMAGVQNDDGTLGVLVANREYYLKNKMAVFLSPASSHIVPPKSSLPVNVSVDATNLFAGNYAGNFIIQSNAPVNPSWTIPAALQVTGLPGLNHPDSISFGQPMTYSILDNYGNTIAKPYYHTFDLVNDGRDNTLIGAMQLKTANPELLVEMQIVDRDWGYSYWTDVSTMLPITIAPSAKVTFRVTLTPDARQHVVTDSLLVSSNVPTGDFTIPIYASVVMPPVLNLDTDQLTVQANTKGYTETKHFVIDNRDGGTALSYSLSLQYYRAKPTTSSVPAAKTKTTSARQASVNATLEAAPPTKIVAASSKRESVQSFDQYNNILQYDSLTSPGARLGFNGTSEMFVGIAFTSPATGFNLSTVITWYAPGEWLSSDLVVEIRGGSDNINDAQLLYTQLFNYTITAPDNTGRFIEIPLEQTQLFYPNEKFFVVIKYPLGTTHPQGTAVLNQNLANTFFYSTGNGNWSDLTTGGFASHGWMIKAAEKQAGPTGWAALGNTIGTVAPGQQQVVNVIFSADYARDADNYAKVKINSNDPVNTNKNELLLLHKNQAPVFANGGTVLLSVLEHDTLHYQLLASDPENDTFTFAMASAPQVAVPSVNGTSFSLITNYTMAGNYEFDVTATDSYGNVSIQKLFVTVVNVNRAPIVTKTLTDRTYYKGDDAELVQLNQVFQDPDGDALTFTSTSSDVSIVNVFSSGSQIIISPEKVGDVTITIVAKDSFGATDTLMFAAHSVAVTGVEPVKPTFNVVAYPNPTNGKIQIHLTGDAASEYSIAVTSVLGINILKQEKISAQTHEVELDLSTASAGIYLVEVADQSGRTVKRIVKQ
jgi:subtilisin family serine protease